MTEESFNPEKTLVILLGASAWHPDRTSFAHSHPAEDNPFQRSVDGMRDYFLKFLKIPAENLKDLFNSQDNADAILKQLEGFLKESGTDKTDLFIYYVGHGIVSTGKFYFTIPSAEDEDYDLVSEKLWRILGRAASHLRCYFILDACYSGNMTELRVSVPNGPKSTLFFCSAPNETLRIDRNEKGENITVFTEALLKTLQGENPYLPVFPSQLSFNELEAPLKQFLQKSYPRTPEPRFDPIAITLKNLKIFKNTRLSKILPKIKEEFPKHPEAILPIAKSVHNYLRNVENKELIESDKSQLDQLAKFLTGETSAEKFIEFWRTHPVIYELNYQELSEKLQQGKIVVFLGTTVPEQDTMLLNQLKKVVNLDGHLSQLCEYIQLKDGEDGRETFYRKIDSISQSESPPLYELLAKIKEPLTIISTEYTTLLEETFKKYQKPFVTLSIDWRDNEKRGRLSLKSSDNPHIEDDITGEKLSALNLGEKYTLIYKIRGCINLNKQHLILSESDYFYFARFLEKSIPDYLVASIKNLELLFIDYYPNHWEDRLIAQTILTRPNMNITAIHGNVDSSFIKTYWEKNGVIHSEKLDEFVEKLTAYLAVSEDSDVP